MPSELEDLPLHAKKLLVTSYQNALKTHTEKQAKKIAMDSVKQVFKKKDNKWVQKSDIVIKTAIGKSGFFKPNYYFDAVLSSDKRDSQRQKVSKTLLEYMSKNNKIEETGDLEHLSFDGKTDKYKGLFKKQKHLYQDGKLFVRFYLDKDHPEFKNFYNSNKNRELGLSAEFYDVRIMNDMIVYASNIGWTLTEDPANTDASIIKVEKIE